MLTGKIRAAVHDLLNNILHKKALVLRLFRDKSIFPNNSFDQ